MANITLSDNALPNIAPVDELQNLEGRINALLPPRYTSCFEATPPSSMGSAVLLYDVNGKVRWGEIWTTFCHLALAGGPPHRGRFLSAVSAEEVQASPKAYEEVVAELTRALGLCIDLPIHPSSQPSSQLGLHPGWIGIECNSEGTAAWLVRAIIAENVIARHEGAMLYVPAGPNFRIEKEMKNVVVCVAKSCHYLFDHLEPEQQPTGDAPSLFRPPLPHEINALGQRYEQLANSLAQSIESETGLTTRRSESPGWIGIECGDEETAVWLLRAVAVGNVLARREEATLFVPIDPRPEEGAIPAIATIVTSAHRLSRLRGK